MSDHPTRRESPSPLPAEQHITDLCLPFDQAWKAGERPRIEDVLADRGPAGEHGELLRELLEIEVYYRRRAGEAVRPEDYLPRFPEQADLVRSVAVVRPAARYEETIGDLLSHLFVHQIHHRGQVHAMLAGTAVKPPQLDEFFLEQDAPLREQELREISLQP